MPTWRCSGRADAAYVLDHLGELVVKEVHGSGGYGMLVGPKATKAEIADFALRVRAKPGKLHRPAHAGAIDLSDLCR